MEMQILKTSIDDIVDILIAVQKNPIWQRNVLVSDCYRIWKDKRINKLGKLGEDNARNMVINDEGHATYIFTIECLSHFWKAARIGYSEAFIEPLDFQKMNQQIKKIPQLGYKKGGQKPIDDNNVIALINSMLVTCTTTNGFRYLENNMMLLFVGFVEQVRLKQLQESSNQIKFSLN